MTLDEAITSCMEVVAEEMKICREICPTAYVVSPACTETAKIHLQLAEWLEELKQRRKQPEVRHGRWIFVGEVTMHDGWTHRKYKCSECGFSTVEAINFCQKCGTTMDIY